MHAATQLNSDNPHRLPAPFGGALRLAAGALSGGRQLLLLTYHRVLPVPDPLLPGEVDAIRFDAQVGFLARHFCILPLTEAAERMRSNSLPRRAVCITLDDGYANNCEVALPILQRYAATATCFIATSFIGDGVMWNDAVIESIRSTRCVTLDLASAGLGCFALGSVEERRRAIDAVLEGLRYRRAPERADAVARVIEAAGIEMPRGQMLNVAQIRTLHAAGVEIGAHTVSHPILASLDEVQARKEIEESGVRLGEIVRAPVRAFAYPNGRPGRDYHREHVKMVRAAGYQLAVSTAWGPVRGAADQWQMPRIAPWDRTLLRFGVRLIRTYCQRQVATV